MPKPIFLEKEKQSIVDTNFMEVKSKMVLEPIVLDKLLRKKRSSEYLELVGKLDTVVHGVGVEEFNKFVSKIREEFPEIPVQEQLLAIVGKCYLGEPYEIHTLSIAQTIITHFKRNETLPEEVQRARNLALHPTYLFIEVYSNTLRAVKSDGSVVVV